MLRFGSVGTFIVHTSQPDHPFTLR